MSDQTLAELILENADSLDFEAELVVDGESYKIVVREAVVAVLEPGALEVRLRPAVAAAALRTPDVESSPRGRGWVRFVPSGLDDFARDRALAWLESAIGLAIEAQSRD